MIKKFNEFLNEGVYGENNINIFDQLLMYTEMNNINKVKELIELYNINTETIKEVYDGAFCDNDTETMEYLKRFL